MKRLTALEKEVENMVTKESEVIAMTKKQSKSLDYSSKETRPNVFKKKIEKLDCKLRDELFNAINPNHSESMFNTAPKWSYDELDTDADETSHDVLTSRSQAKVELKAFNHDLLRPSFNESWKNKYRDEMKRLKSIDEVNSHYTQIKADQARSSVKELQRVRSATSFAKNNLQVACETKRIKPHLKYRTGKGSSVTTSQQSLDLNFNINKSYK